MTPRDLGIDADRVAPKLWVGAYNPDDAKLRAAGFTKVIRVAYELPHNYPLDDSPDTGPNFLRPAMKAAADAARAIRAGQRVLITCQMGVNRSAFVAATVMIKHYGFQPAAAVAAIRAARKPRPPFKPLSNQHFVAALMRLTPGGG